MVSAPKVKKRSLMFWKGDQSANDLSEVFNNLASDNWEYQTSESGLGGAGDMLVFRREIPKLEETSQREVAQLIAPETFERPVVPRRLRPAAYPDNRTAEFKSQNTGNGTNVAPLRLEAAIAKVR